MRSNDMGSMAAVIIAFCIGSLAAVVMSSCMPTQDLSAREDHVA